MLVCEAYIRYSVSSPDAKFIPFFALTVGQTDLVNCYRRMQISSRSSIRWRGRYKFFLDFQNRTSESGIIYYSKLSRKLTNSRIVYGLCSLYSGSIRSMQHQWKLLHNVVFIFHVENGSPEETEKTHRFLWTFRDGQYLQAIFTIYRQYLQAIFSLIRSYS